MNDEPFYVPVGRGRVNLHTGQRGGYYLPALEPPTEPEEDITQQVIKRYTYISLDKKALELHQRLFALEEEVKKLRIVAKEPYTIK